MRRTLHALLACMALGGAPTALAQAQGAPGALLAPPKPQRSAAEHKVAARLLSAARAYAATPAAGHVPAGIPDPVRAFLQGHVAVDGSTFVVIHAPVSEELVATLQALGARDVARYPRFDTVTATVPADQVLSIAALPDVRSIGPRELHATRRYFPTAEERAEAQVRYGAVAKVGTKNWEGVAAHGADRAQQAGFSGSGSKVCVLSDGVDTLASRVATGDLPPTTVLSGQAGSGDEGTAMLEIVHDMAPGAALAFATAGNSMAQFASNILALRSAGCDIIVDDVGFFAEGAFQDGPVAKAVNSVSAAGALYFSAAGNSGSLSHGTAATFEGDFFPATSGIPTAIASAEGTASVQLHSFAGVPYTTLTRQTQYVTLQWAEPAGAAASDYDLFVTDSTGSTILGYPGIDSQTGTQDPVEFAVCDGCAFPAGARVYVVKYSGAARAIRVDAIFGRLSNATKGGTYGHAATTGAIAVGAVDVRSASGGAFVGGGTNPTTYYSSDGPRRFFFTPTGAAVTPGNTLFNTNGGITVAKLDFAASDCGTTTTPGFTPFCGTSAAAPSAAAVAALVRSAGVGLTPSQVRAAMDATTLDIQAAGIDIDSGRGIPMASRAIASLLQPVAVTKSFSPGLLLLGATSTLSIQVTNPNGVALAGVSLAGTYTSPMVNAATPNARVSGTGCTSTFAPVASAGTWSIALTLPARTTCTFLVDVTVGVAGTYSDGNTGVATPLGTTAVATAQLTAGNLPGAPTSLGVSLGANSLVVAFSPPASNGGLAITRYTATCTPDGGGAAVTATASLGPIAVLPVANGSTYTCAVTATNAMGTGPAAAAAPVTVPKLDQGVTFTSAPPASAFVGGPGYTAVATATSGLAVTLSIDPASGATCTLGSGNTVSFIAAGTCIIRANQAGNATFNAAPQAVQSIAAVVPTDLVALSASVDVGAATMGTVTPEASVSFGNFTPSAIDVTGVSAAAPFAVTTTDCVGSLAPGTLCTVHVVLVPPASVGAVGSTQALTGAVTVTSTAHPDVAVALAGVGERSMVRHYYRRILGREPDASGQAFWDGEAVRMASLGVDVNEAWYVVAGYFFGSSEYLSYGKTDAQFVSDLYNTFFNRAADAGGLGYWVAQIQGGLPREVVMFSFMFSPEFTAFTQSIFGNTAARPEVNVVMDFFRGILNRLPDTPAYQYWVGQLRTAQCAGAGPVYTAVDTISGAFIFNPEYNNRARDNTQLVTDLYYSFLRRGGDAAGVQYWVNQLQTGAMDVNGVRMNFLNSPEFGARVQAVIAAGCMH